MANEVKLQDAMQSDFTAVVSDIAEELLARLNIDEDGSVIDMFQTGSFESLAIIRLLRRFRKSSR